MCLMLWYITGPSQDACSNEAFCPDSSLRRVLSSGDIVHAESTAHCENKLENNTRTTIS